MRRRWRLASAFQSGAMGLRLSPTHGAQRPLTTTATDRNAQPVGPNNDPNASSTRSRPLEKTHWLGLHPVIKWTMLVDVARRAPYLLTRPVVDATSPSTSSSPSVASAATMGGGPLLGDKDAQVHFSPTSTAQHARLCAALPYSARLLLILSLLLWLRSLRDVQDTLARVRLPYAPTQRLRHLIVAHVFPTRLQEYWCDHYTTVTERMDPSKNGTAEQVPAPHVWDPATSETVEDSATESTLVLQGHRSKGLLGGVPRAQVVRQIQGATARPSDDDALATRMTGSRTAGGQQRRRLAASRAREKAMLGSGRAASELELPSTSAGPQEWSSRTAPPSRRASGPIEQWDLPASRRMAPPVRMDRDHKEDARYHHNTDRGEGCPLSDSGALHAMPIYIHVPPTMTTTTTIEAHQCDAPPRCEAEVRACVMAHAAVLSALFIEGRVVDFSTNNALVYDYVACVFEEWIDAHYMTVVLTDPADAPAASKTAASTSSSIEMPRPYFPSWCFRNVLVVLPPRGGPDDALYSDTEAVNMARTIVHAAPCAVMVQEATAPHGPSSDGTSPVRLPHVKQLEEAVVAVQAALAAATTTCASGAADTQAQEEAWAAATRAGGWLHVDWVPVRQGATSCPGGTAGVTAPTTSGHAQDEATPAFRPNTATRVPSTNTSFSPRRAFLSTLSWLITSRASVTSSPAPPPSDANRYLTAVTEALEGGEFYATQIVYSADNSAYSSRQLRQWMLEDLPSNVRLVGVNTSPFNGLYFYPQAPFLTGKVGNSFRYKAVDRVLIEKFGAGWAVDPLRAALGRCRWARRGRPWDRVGVHCALPLRDRAACVVREKRSHRANKTGCEADRTHARDGDAEDADDALVRERTIEYLANPGKGTLIALIAAKLLGI